MSNIVDINSRKNIEHRNFATVPHSFSQNKNLFSTTIAVALYMNSKSYSHVPREEIKEHFDIDDDILSYVFEQLIENGYMKYIYGDKGEKLLCLSLYRSFEKEE